MKKKLLLFCALLGLFAAVSLGACKSNADGYVKT